MPVTAISPTQLSRALQQTLDNAGKGHLIKVTQQVLGVAAGATVAVAIPLGANLVNIKSIYIQASVATTFETSITDQAVTSSFQDYLAQDVNTTLYDLVDLPYSDEDSAQTLHMTITNKGTASVDFTVKIKAIELQ